MGHLLTRYICVIKCRSNLPGVLSQPLELLFSANVVVIHLECAQLLEPNNLVAKDLIIALLKLVFHPVKIVKCQDKHLLVKSIINSEEAPQFVFIFIPLG